MAISYNKLWKLLVDKKMSKADLRKAAGIAPNTMTRLRRDEEVTLATVSFEEGFSREKQGSRENYFPLLYNQRTK